MNGRFAPSPTGPLHVGNLRTALLAWLFARSAGSEWYLRMEDLDPIASRPEHEQAQCLDLLAIGLAWNGAVIRQSERRARYDVAIAQLTAAGLTYECYCTRKEIQAAAQAPHGPQPDGAYPGTCRELGDRERRRRRRDVGRRPALRLRAGNEAVTIIDRQLGSFTATVDDFVLHRSDGVAAYNLAVVVDDDAQGVDEVVRGDDLLASTPRQVHLARLLGLAPPAHAHVPMVLAPDGARLAKRHGAVTLADRAARGETPMQVLAVIAASLGLCEPDEPLAGPSDLLDRFAPASLPRAAWTVPAEWL
jgi:glutamyl-tRNA synthetase